LNIGAPNLMLPVMDVTTRDRTSGESDARALPAARVRARPEEEEEDIARARGWEAEDEEEGGTTRARNDGRSTA
jgi:hypothetical protein